MCCCGLVALSRFAMQPFAIKLFAFRTLLCTLFPPTSLVEMAAEQTWTGSDVELVGSSIPPTDTEVEIVSSSEAWEMVKAEKQELKEEPAMVEDEADFSADPRKEEAEQAPSTATDPPTTTDQAADNSTDPTPPPATDTPMPPAADTPSKKPTVGLSSLKALEPLEATEGEGPKPTLVAAKPASKAAAVKKVAKRQRAFLLEGQPTSADEMPPPPLDSFLRMGAKSKSAAKRAPSVSAARRAPSVQPKPRGRSLDRSRSQPRITGPPIRPLSPQRPKTSVSLMHQRIHRIAKGHCEQCQVPTLLRNLGTRIVAIFSTKLIES